MAERTTHAIIRPACIQNRGQLGATMDALEMIENEILFRIKWRKERNMPPCEYHIELRIVETKEEPLDFREWHRQSRRGCTMCDLGASRDCVSAYAEYCMGARETGRMIPLSERLPDMGVDVLLLDDWISASNGNRYTHYRVGHLKAISEIRTEKGVEVSYEWGGRCDSFFNITHWQPLPKDQP